jgi:hypothetical protein
MALVNLVATVRRAMAAALGIRTTDVPETSILISREEAAERLYELIVYEPPDNDANRQLDEEIRVQLLQKPGAQTSSADPAAKILRDLYVHPSVVNYGPASWKQKLADDPGRLPEAHFIHYLTEGDYGDLNQFAVERIESPPLRFLQAAEQRNRRSLASPIARKVLKPRSPASRARKRSRRSRSPSSEKSSGSRSPPSAARRAKKEDQDHAEPTAIARAKARETRVRPHGSTARETFKCAGKRVAPTGC